MSQIEKIASTHLGTGAIYEDVNEIRPDLLVAVPRALGRKESNITFTDFEGYDVWNAYEFSTLKPTDIPFIAKLKIIYGADSEFIVESKSLKLYLHSFNFVCLGESDGEIISEVKKRIKSDLEHLLKTEVSIGVFTLGDRVESKAFKELGWRFLDEEVEYEEEKKYEGIVPLIVPDKSDPFLLDNRGKTNDIQCYRTDSMRSNCRVTHQPDWASVFIRMVGEQRIDSTSLLRYILSLRKEYHFHEEACELLFNSLYTRFNCRELAVMCLYTRRGGIDINPVRYVGMDIANSSLKHPDIGILPFFRQ